MTQVYRILADHVPVLKEICERINERICEPIAQGRRLGPMTKADLPDAPLFDRISEVTDTGGDATAPAALPAQSSTPDRTGESHAQTATAAKPRTGGKGGTGKGTAVLAKAVPVRRRG